MQEESRVKIELSVEEWASFSREKAESSDSSLGICCADISNMRDVILDIGRNDGVVTEELEKELRWAWGELSTTHGENENWRPAFLSLLSQAGLEWPSKGTA